ncbi:GlsB/YeaQ/YmgE family stress response membrane protein [Lacunimicrobium album]|jgi:uncharacterized membrane protein YeaQ/YmgE (transglycosylase-associated protein family)
MPTIYQIIVWLIVGALAGSLVGMLVTFSKVGFGKLTNLGIGLAGALLGGLIFKLFGINFGLGEIKVSLEEIVAAIIGSLILLFIWWLYNLSKGRTKID